MLLGRKMLTVPLHFRKKLFVWNYHNSQLNLPLDAVFQIRIRSICKFLGLSDPHLLARIQLRILPSTGKNIKKKLDLVTFED
jgi:hypothetical protein